jgi:hypothetical protein
LDKQEFLKQQYLTLREEVKETKARIFKTLGFGLVVVPAAHFLAQSYHIDTVILSIPILVIVVALVYLSENNALMRCGRYIRLHIESQIEGVLGWETWLETPGLFETRDVDKYLSYRFYLLFFVYFVGSVFLAARFAIQQYGQIAASLLLGLYVAIGIWFVIYLIKHILVSTSTKLDGK